MYIRDILLFCNDLRAYTKFLLINTTTRRILIPPFPDTGFKFASYWLYNHKTKTWKMQDIWKFRSITFWVKRLQ